MAKQYVVTEEEFLALIESLELHALRDNNVIGPNTDKTGMHRGFHYVVTRWVQSMGFKAHR